MREQEGKYKGYPDLRHSRAMQATLETQQKSLQSVSLPTVFTS